MTGKQANTGMSRIRKQAGMLVVLVTFVVLAGTALARWPALGSEWGELTYYDSSGQAIGGMRIECDGYQQTWGSTNGRRGPMQIYPCL